MSLKENIDGHINDESVMAEFKEEKAGNSDSAEKRNRKRELYRKLQILSCISFILFAGLFINEVFIQPYRSRKVVQEVQKLYPGSAGNSLGGNLSQSPSPSSLNDNTQSANQNPERDSKGRLRKFIGLLRINEDVKGWIIVPDSEINYPVLQSTKDDPEYYLTRNIYREPDKQGSLFIDVNSSVEENTKNIVIYGHNMKSGTMFHDLAKYQDINYYKERPVLYFDTIYQTGVWKVIAVIITNGSSKYGDIFFNYTRSTFADSSDYLNFVYQLRVRSLYNINVDVNENDQLLTLSTCSYELPDYRTVVVARKVRDGEDPEVNVENTKKNNPLYPQSWYETYGGKPPKVSTFEEALKAGEIDWYTPANKKP